MAAGKRSKGQGRCALCKNIRELQKSHLLPAALYRRMRTENDANPNPVMMTRKISRQTSQQLKAYLLCQECERRFNASGETWVLARYFHENKFLLHDILMSATPIWPNRNISVFAAKKIPSIKVRKLVYFASSVFWRASVHSWKFWGVPVNIDLGKRYEEEFRQYLLGAADFPNNAVIWVSVCASRESHPSFNFPAGKRIDTYHHYHFAIPGIVFDLFVGGVIPLASRRMCTLRSQENFIYLSEKVDERIMSDIVKSFGRTSGV